MLCILGVDVSSVLLHPFNAPSLGISIVENVVDVTLSLVLANLHDLSQYFTQARWALAYHCVLFSPNYSPSEQPSPLWAGEEALATC